GRDPNHGVRSALFKLADIGWSGVDLFFVLSGFLITGILLRSRSAPRQLRNFYARRALRILPLYYLAILLVFAALPVLGICPPTPVAGQAPYWFYAANFFSQWAPIDCLRIDHFWSLAVEEQYYLFWPFVVAWSDRRTLMRLCVGLYFLSLVFRAVA